MESPVDSWDYGNSPVSPTPYRHAHDFSSLSLFSVSSSTMSNPSFSRHGSSMMKKPPKQRLIKLMKHSLKHTLKCNAGDSNGIEYWTKFHSKLKRIIGSFHDGLSKYDALNDPYCFKPSSKTCFSVIHILCKQFYLYCRSHNWSISFKIMESIRLLLENGANTAIFYRKLNESPQKNFNSIHTLYGGLQLMLTADVITNSEFTNHISRAISGGNECIHNALIASLNVKSMNTSLSSIDSRTSTSSLPDLSATTSYSTQCTSFKPSVLTLCIYNDSDNITYWMADCLYHDYYVNLMSPYLASAFVMMGYDLLSLVLEKRDHLDYNDKSLLDVLIYDEMEIKSTFNTYSIHAKVIAFLWFIRYGDFLSDLVNIIDIGIKQLALNEFCVSTQIIESILSYSHGFIVSNTKDSVLDLIYFDADKWMMTAFELLFKLDNYWIDWIAYYVMPKLTSIEINKIRSNLSSQTSDRGWNKFIQRISLKSINAFCKHDIFGVISSVKMQYIITKNYQNPDLIPILINAKYDICETFGNCNILYNILNDSTMDSQQIDNILAATYIALNDDVFAAKLIINDLLFGVCDWQTNQSIYRNIFCVFNEKYTLFCSALNDWFYELTTEQHHEKFIFFMNANLINFNYCLNGDLIESALNTLLCERAFNKKAQCFQMIGDWILKNSIHKKECAKKAIDAIQNAKENNNNTQKIDQDTVIIEQYLDQLTKDLSR